MTQNSAGDLESTDIYGKHYKVSADQLAWRPAAYAIVADAGKIMLVKHNGKFHLPGGGVEIGEHPEAAVLREFTEETGLRAADPKLIDVISTFFSYEAYDTHKLSHLQSLLFYYKCELTKDKQKAVELDEYEKLYHHSFEWVSIEQLKTITVGTTVDWRPVVEKAIFTE